MPDKFEIKINLVVVASNPEKVENSHFLVLEDNTFPNVKLSYNKDITKVVNNLLTEYTGITENWVLILPFGIFDIKQDVVSVLYGAFIPEQTRIKKENSKWVKYTEVSKFDESYRKMAEEIVWRQA